MRVQDKKSLALAPPAAKRALSLLLFFHFMSIFTPSWGKVSFFSVPLLWAFTVLYSELSAFAWMGALGKNGLLLY
jgi:hypothetical protein